MTSDKTVTPTLEETIRIIIRLHGDQKQWNGEPYWQHPLRVMLRLPDDVTLEDKQIGLLHDVLEDTPTTQEDLLLMGFSPYVVEGVRLLSRNHWPVEVSYLDGVRLIAASGHVGAMRSKRADNLENSDPERIADNSEEDRAKGLSMRPRYLRSIEILNQGIAAAEAEGRDMKSSPF